MRTEKWVPQIGLDVQKEFGKVTGRASVGRTVWHRRPGGLRHVRLPVQPTSVDCDSWVPFLF